MTPLEFVVLGRPQPQGSMRAFTPRGSKWPVLTSDNPQLRSWRNDVRVAASHALGGAIIQRGTPVAISATFWLSRPSGLARRYHWPTRRPDLDKLLRALCDALTGVAIEDDAQIVLVRCEKRYGAPERTEIRVIAIDGDATTEAVGEPSLFAAGEREP